MSVNRTIDYLRTACCLCVLLFAPLFGKSGNGYQATADLNIRSGPSASNTSIGIVKNGEKLLVVDSSNSYWFRIAYNGDTGYVAKKYLLHLPDEVKKPDVIEVVTGPIKSRGWSESTKIWVMVLSGIALLMFALAVGRRKKPVKTPVHNFQPKTNTPPIQPKAKVTAAVVRQNPQNVTVEVKVRKEPEKSINTVVAAAHRGAENIKQMGTNKPASLSQNNTINNDSVIDVGDQALPLPQATGTGDLQKYSPGIPPWSHRYIYSSAELANANSEQKLFYAEFKRAFLTDIHYDVEGNSNYPFILLFDLEENSYGHDNIDLLAQQYDTLSKFYPKIGNYTADILIRRYEQIGDFIKAAELRTKHRRYPATNNSFSADYWGLGTRSKAKLNLTNDQVKTLNKLIDTSNNFNTIEFISKHLIFSFFAALDGLTRHFTSCGTTLEQEISKIAETELLKHYKFKKGSKNYKEQFGYFSTTIHQVIFKTGENKLREHFFIGRKTELTWYIRSAEALAQFTSVFSEPLDRYLSEYLGNMEVPDDATEIEFNDYGKARWKSKLENIKITCEGTQHQMFFDSVLKLGQQNEKNPAIENIFFEASKHIAKSDKITALKLYVHYVDRDLRSVSFDNKPLTKTIHKALFQNPEQSTEFENIISGLVKDKNLDKALKLVPEIYQPKRKKIKLDRNKIKEVQEQHSETVELLNEYLRDENEALIEKEVAVSTSDLQAQPMAPVVASISIFRKDIMLNDVQANALVLLSKNGYAISKTDFDTFAKSNGAFRNSLIESINDSCFEVLDDVLIEEAEDSYAINESYYEQILEK